MQVVLGCFIFIFVCLVGWFDNSIHYSVLTMISVVTIKSSYKDITMLWTLLPMLYFSSLQSLYLSLIVVWMCIFLMTNDVEPFYVDLLAIFYVFFEECHSDPLPMFFISCKSSLYILEIAPHQIWLSNIISNSVCCLFTSSILYFEAKKCF